MTTHVNGFILEKNLLIVPGISFTLQSDTDVVVDEVEGIVRCVVVVDDCVVVVVGCDVVVDGVVVVGSVVVVELVSIEVVVQVMLL